MSKTKRLAACRFAGQMERINGNPLRYTMSDNRPDIIAHIQGWRSVDNFLSLYDSDANKPNSIGELLDDLLERALGDA